jgi:hypothetical protein
MNIYYNLLSSVLPNLLLIQSVLSTSNSFILAFPQSYDFRLISQILLAVYIPIYTIAIGILFQFDLVLGYPTIPWLISFWIVYTISLFLPYFTQNWTRTVIESVLALVLIVIFHQVCDRHGYGTNLVDYIFRGLTNYLFLTTVISDYLISRVFSNRHRQESELDAIKADISQPGLGLHFHELSEL